MDEEVERRLREWGRWKCGDSVLGFGTPSAWNTASSRAGYKVVPIPTVACDAQVTDHGIKALPAEQRAVVQCLYADNNTVVATADTLGVARATVYARLESAHALLAAWFAERTRVAEAEHQRVQVLGAGWGRWAAKRSFKP